MALGETQEQYQEAEQHEKKGDRCQDHHSPGEARLGARCFVSVLVSPRRIGTRGNDVIMDKVKDFSSTFVKRIKDFNSVVFSPGSSDQPSKAHHVCISR